ncbi:winged helix-turn-helix domain-containing protein [Pseudoalteromonas rubra]|uniref:OmpR/PhoB-type domain-containing protein n=1 Tax=Pseudoalteromonas rubra TaxID=43658 RepID=A0A0F4QGP3_9GAMM|nr:winged helix-turn-helix domain-containing protein [Pseudoalteromonas rubra]KJZ06440.1 hypothetical protein TW77_19385 [Pseudoalteromonas rubra]
MNEVRFSRQVKEVRFGAWILDPKHQSITDGEVERELEPLLFRLLCYLIINNEQIITRQNLVEDVWAQHYVDDNAINRAMSELRKILKSEKQKGTIVKTHYRKGYSFFLEPEIVYYEHVEKPSTSYAAANTDSNTPSTLPEQPVLSTQQHTAIADNHGKRALRWRYVLLPLLLILAPLAWYILPAGLFTTNQESHLLTRSKIEESVLSWLPGRYATLNLSPNKQQVAFSFIQSDNKNYALVVKSLESGHEKRIGNPGVNYFPVGWSVDSSFIYYRAVSEEQCQVWQLSADFITSNRHVFDCTLHYTTGGGVSAGRFVYSKSGYRNRDELSVLTSRDLSSGDEFQITSPNLNSYGDRFLTYIAQKQVILFERRQYESNELYMTDLDGGNQVKLFESANRIWAVNYNAEQDLVSWFDNTANQLYRFSLAQQRLHSVEQLQTAQQYASSQILDSNTLLMVSYPFQADVFLLDQQTFALTELISSPLEDTSATEVGDEFLFLTRQGDQRIVRKQQSDGQIVPLALPQDGYTALRYNSASDHLLLQYKDKIEVYKLSDMTLADSIDAEGVVVAAEFIGPHELGYVVVDDHKVKSRVFSYSLTDKKVTPLPTSDSLWIGRLDDEHLVSLSSSDKVVLYNIQSGEITQTIDLPQVKYKHTLAIGEGDIYHSDGETIYKLDFSTPSVISEFYHIDTSKYVISNMKYSQKRGGLILDLIEVVENQLIKVTLKEAESL